MNLMISKIPLRHRSAAIAAMQADVAVDILSYVIGKSALGRMPHHAPPTLPVNGMT
jgi:hypothetical protein